LAAMQASIRNVFGQCLDDPLIDGTPAIAQGRYPIHTLTLFIAFLT
jgi:hypothetical protein